MSVSTNTEQSPRPKAQTIGSSYLGSESLHQARPLSAEEFDKKRAELITELKQSISKGTTKGRGLSRGRVRVDPQIRQRAEQRFVRGLRGITVETDVNIPGPFPAYGKYVHRSNGLERHQYEVGHQKTKRRLVAGAAGLVVLGAVVGGGIKFGPGLLSGDDTKEPSTIQDVGPGVTVDVPEFNGQTSPEAAALPRLAAVTEAYANYPSLLQFQDVELS